MSGLSYYNQSVSKYINGEPWQHVEAKRRVRGILEKRGYDVKTDPEHVIVVPIHKDFENARFPIDVFATSRTCPDTDKIAVQLDGEYHRAGNIQPGRRQNRDDTLSDYCAKHNIRYVVINHANCIQDIIDTKNGYSDMQLAEKLGLGLQDG